MNKRSKQEVHLILDAYLDIFGRKTNNYKQFELTYTETNDQLYNIACFFDIDKDEETTKLEFQADNWEENDYSDDNFDEVI